MDILSYMHFGLELIIEIAILLFEYIGTGILILVGAKGLINFIRRSPHVRLELAQGFVMGLEFKLGGEILRTVVVKDMQELYIVGGIIVLRAALTFLIHWEIQGEAPRREDVKKIFGRHSE